MSQRAVTFDAGALIALERQSAPLHSLIRDLALVGGLILIPAGALAQVYRGGPRQHALRRLLAGELVRVIPLDTAVAMRAGALCAATGTADVIDASVVDCAAQHGRTPILTTDPGDLAKLDPAARLLTL